MCSAAVALAPPIAVGADPTEPDAYTILARVKAQWRTRQPPPYVAYTLVRHDTFNGEPDLADSYTLRIWCRTADNAALSRRVFGSRVRGNAEFIMPAFDKPIDPGPPTADLLAVMRSSEPTPTPSAPGSVPLIGSVASVIETTYDVSVVGSDATDVHLQLRARRDPDRNRLTDLYVDRRSYAIDRAVAHDHLYAAGQAIPQRFEIDFGAAADIPVIRSIHGQTDYAELDVRSGEPLYEVDYRFENIVFPSTLPPWYFEPARYGEHRAELPVE
jgi:hypothetical protein